MKFNNDTSKNSRYMTRISPLPCCLMVSLSMFTAGCTNSSTPAPIMLGQIAAGTGPEKAAGEAAAHGIRLAVEELNKDTNKSVGRPLAVIHAQARSMEDFEADAVRLVAINHVAFLLGGATQEEVERLDRARVPVLTPLGSRGRNLSDGVYCTGLSPESHGKMLAQFAALELGVTALTIVQDERNEEFVQTAEALAREFASICEKKGAKAAPVRRLSLTREIKVNDLTQTIHEQIKTVGNASGAVVFAGQVDDLRALGALLVPVLFAGSQGSGPALAALRSAGKDIYFVTAFVPDTDTPRTVEFATRYHQAFHEEADVHAAIAYEGIKLLNEALIRCKDNLTLQRVREELTNLHDVDGLAGLLSFTPEHQLRRAAFMVRIDDTGMHTVKRYSPEP
jgi:ABC-type branched-subunit amino acid transport system substrate-binding protein